jgi:WD40 repeat protein
LPSTFLASFSPDGRTLALLENEQCSVWDTATGKHIRSIPSTRTNLYDGCHPQFSHDGKLLALAGGRVVLYDWATGKCLTTFENLQQVYGLAFSPNGHYLALAPYDGPLRLWDMRSREFILEIKDKEPHFDQPYLCFSPDSRILAWSSFYQDIKLADIAAGKVVSRFCRTAAKPLSLSLPMVVAWSPPDGAAAFNSGTWSRRKKFATF